ncbi:MAG: phosphoribosylaminoimidazolesuccinocarboxamide synthase [Candidatus Omnitrophota bacterium]|nr:MAG: phosphoribosylaminoimidazolesuccinocarboxamide synthase [Candidatus Omnitrophota bacterium]
MQQYLSETINLLGVKFFKRGKVREIYDLEDKLLIISTDRISCFDVILPDTVPDKGRILTEMSIFWFQFIKDIITTHFITAAVSEYPEQLQAFKKSLQGRSMLVKKTEPIPIECIVRGYLSGSAWQEYKKSQSICGIHLPTGLKESDKLPEVIFTPSTKADSGHDLNITQEYVKNNFGNELANELKEKSIAIYQKAAEYALDKGIIIADTKFEFGKINNEIILIDEVLTPDSSRFWPRKEYIPGNPQPSFDKQFVRDYLQTSGWSKNSPAPKLPEEIIVKTMHKYQQALVKIVQ